MQNIRFFEDSSRLDKTRSRWHRIECICGFALLVDWFGSPSIRDSVGAEFLELDCNWQFHRSSVSKLDSKVIVWAGGFPDGCDCFGGFCDVSRKPQCGHVGY